MFKNKNNIKNNHVTSCPFLMSYYVIVDVLKKPFTSSLNFIFICKTKFLTNKMVTGILAVPVTSCWCRLL